MSETKPETKAIRRPVPYRYDLIRPEFLAALALILHDGAKHDEEAGVDTQWQRGLHGDASPINHALKHLIEYQGHVPHDKYGSRKMQLAAAAVNIMFEFWFESQRELAALNTLSEAIKAEAAKQAPPAPTPEPEPAPEPAKPKFDFLDMITGWAKGAKGVKDGGSSQ